MAKPSQERRRRENNNMSIPVGRDGSKFAYFLLDTTHVDYAGNLNKLDTHNKSFLPNNITSVLLNNSGTKALIKAVEVDESARQRFGSWSSSIGGITLDLLTLSDLDRMRNVIRTSPEWSNSI